MAEPVPMPAEIGALASAFERASGDGASVPAGERIVGWRITWNWVQDVEVGVKDAEAANVYSPLSMSEGIAARTLIEWEDGRISLLRAGRAELEHPESLIRVARRAAYEDPDAANFAGPHQTPSLPLFAAATAAVVEGEVEPLAALLRVARAKAADHGFSNYSGTVSAAHRRGGVITSRGCDIAGESSEFSYYFWFDGLAGEGLMRREVIPATVAVERLEAPCELARRLKSPESDFRGGVLPVLLHPQVAESFFSTYVMGNLSGEQIWNRQSAFRIEQFRQGAVIAREDLSIRLDPLVPLGPGSFRFTGEGVPARRADYIVSGRLVAPILDLKYARRFGMDPVPPPAAIESLRIEAAEEVPYSEALPAIGRGLLVLGVLGLHTQDPASGDFSVAAPQSLAISGGSLGGRVRAALTGNFLQALRSPELRLVAFPGFHMPGLLLPAGVNVE